MTVSPGVGNCGSYLALNIHQTPGRYEIRDDDTSAFRCWLVSRMNHFYRRLFRVVCVQRGLPIFLACRVDVVKVNMDLNVRYIVHDNLIHNGAAETVADVVLVESRMLEALAG